MSSKNVDMLSQLPEEILSRILSQMRTKFAVRTSVLSKRWRYTWTFVTNFSFVDVPSKPSFPEFVHGVLNSCKTSQIDLFRLKLLPYSYTFAQESDVSNWIDKAVKLNVRELHINVTMHPLPISLFTCKTLTKLRISYYGYGHGDWECPCPVNLPSLKILDIDDFQDPFVYAFKLICGSPMLECLSLHASLDNDDGKDYVFSIPTLKRLKLVLRGLEPVMRRVVLNVLNLEFLYVDGISCLPFVIEDVSSLVEAYISFDYYYLGDGPRLWVELVKRISGVKSLSLELLNIGFISPLPIFPNLKHLELSNPCGQILSFLEKCPELEHLHIKQEDTRRCIEKEVVPDCIRTKLTTIKFSCFPWLKRDIKFLEYMLANAELLKTVTITRENSAIEEEERFCAQLLKLTRVSRCCEIHFHKNLSNSSIS